jgi:putative DNA methylase
MTYKKKLIEVALPLEAINVASSREKSIRHGHPSTLHLWWARRPLATCRAVLFSSIVDDPSGHPDKFPTEELQEKERQRLFRIIEELVIWENSNNETVLKKARDEILKATGGNPPPVLDPFCGGGSIPLEAQRLGLEAHGSDLNPVAVMITKAMIEIPQKFVGKPPVHPVDKAGQQSYIKKDWTGAEGLAEDICYYGEWMRNAVEKKIGHLYPRIKLPEENGGCEATVIAWIWARTVKCPNPACGAQMPLIRSFALSTKKGKKAYIVPVIDKKTKKVLFDIKIGEEQVSNGTVNRNGATCILCNSPVSFDHVRSEGKSGRMGAQLMAIVAEGSRGRVYLAPTKEHEEIIKKSDPANVPDTNLPEQALGFRVQIYGMTKHRNLFTPRQLVALTTFSDFIKETREKILADAKAAGMKDDGKGINDGGLGATSYADAVVTYLAFANNRLADRSTTICSWDAGFTKIRNTFARQALPMTWDYAEANPFSGSTGSWNSCLEWIWKVVSRTIFKYKGIVQQLDATAAINSVVTPLISTDPPYYDNIGYADLSDFFYIWLRRSIGKIYPSLFSTVLVPKVQELIATPFRFEGDKQKAAVFFEEGLGKAFKGMKEAGHHDYPLTVYYAFKQSEEEETNDKNDNVVVASTGWETMLEGLIKSGFEITGTWPMRTELANRSISLGTNALASSIILVCRQKQDNSKIISRRDFISELKRELPSALKNLQRGNIAPVDLAQASIGPGMAIFSKYAKVVEADGGPMRVRTALALINQTLDEVLSEQEGDLEPDTRWALTWFKQHGMEEGTFDDAETLSKAKAVSVKGLVEAGILFAEGGIARLLKRDELDPDWDPSTDKRLTVWEVVQHLIRKLDKEGIDGAATLFGKISAGYAESARALAYQLFSICERKKWTQDALGFNSLIIAWPDLQRRSRSLLQEAEDKGPKQYGLGV